MAHNQHWQVTSFECVAENDAADEADEWIDAMRGGFEPPASALGPLVHADRSAHICSGTGRASALPARSSHLASKHLGSASASATRGLMLADDRAEGGRHDAGAAQPDEVQRCAAGPAAADGPTCLVHKEPGSIPTSIDPSKPGPVHSPTGAARMGQDRRPSASPSESPITGRERHCTRGSPATTDGRERVLMRDTFK
jgi:hypothetical protein